MENRKPTILKKAYQKESITRTDKGTDETITKSEESTETINSFFTIMIDNLKIEKKGYKKKGYHENDILVQTIKSHNDMFSCFTHCNFNNSLLSSIFPSALKKADSTPIHKKKSKCDIENYHYISILPVLFKIYESCMYDHM